MDYIVVCVPDDIMRDVLKTMANGLPDCLFECETTEVVQAFFEQKNTSTPATYARLALRKLRSSNPFIGNDDTILPDQEEALRAIADGVGGWHAYCTALTYRQIQCVGW